jgi:plasmid stabilization system protein ParE
MSLRVAFRPEAQGDLLQAHDWYEQQAGLGDAFSDRAEEAIERIQRMPRMYAMVFRDVRRAKIRRFPYLIYYRVQQDRIEVIAVLHGSRDPRLWQQRVN